MKRNILAILALVLTVNVFAQSFDVTKLRAGGGLVYATEISNIGINLNGVYSFTEEWEGALGFTHIFKKDYQTLNVLDFDAHYIFHQVDENLNVYGLAGLGFNFAKVTIPAISMGGVQLTSETKKSDTKLGLNLGVGVNYKLADNLNLSPEMRFTIMDGSYFRIGVGIQYLF
jgi:hypothetical protein